jgi:WhiB family transcriptional regulator, redox-sensing transcriptional regulator
VRDEAWVGKAACRQIPPADRDRIFFPDRTGSNVEAKLICQSCPVRRACLDFAIATGEHFGIWGGTAERERRRIARARRRGQPDPEIRWPSAEAVERLERYGRPPPRPPSSTRSVVDEVGTAHARAQARLSRSEAAQQRWLDDRPIPDDVAARIK